MSLKSANGNERAAMSEQVGRRRHTLRTLQLSARAPFRPDLTAGALRRRPQNTIDVWDGRT